MYLPIFICINLFSWLLFLWIPVQHSKMLVILIFALTGWSMKTLPQPVISLIIIVLIPISGLGTFSESLSGYGKPFVWLLVSTFILSAAMENTGVGKRIALTLMLHAKGRTKRTVLYVLMTLVMLGFLIPTSSGRSAMIMPACSGMIRMIKDKKLAIRFSKNIMLGATFVSTFMGWAVITGSNSSIYAVSTIETITEYQWTYSHWLIINFPIMLIFVLCVWLILGKLFPMDLQEVPGGYRYIMKELNNLGKMKGSEWRILLIGFITLMGWVTEPYHGLSVPLVALIGAIVSCIPKIGVQTWQGTSARISWDAVILFGAGFALADALQRNQTAVWLASKIAGAISQVSPLGAALTMLAIVLLVRLGFAETLAITATFLPVTISLADIWGINSIWLVQIVIIACSFGYFFPFQSTSNLITFSHGNYTEKDLLFAGILVSPIVIIVVLLSALFYWPLIDLSPTVTSMP